MAKPSLLATGTHFQVGATAIPSSVVAPIVANNFITVAVLTWNPSGVSVSAVVDSSGNTYSRTGALSYDTSNGRYQIFWTPNAVATTSASNSVSVRLVATASFCYIVAQSWSWDSTKVISLQGASAANPPLVSGTAIATPNITTSYADSLLLGFADWFDSPSPTYTDDTGIISLLTNGAYIMYRLSDAAGNYTLRLDSGVAGSSYYLGGYALHQTPATGATARLPTLPLLGAGQG